MSYVWVDLWGPLVLFTQVGATVSYEAWLAWTFCHAATIRRSRSSTDPLPPEPA